MEKEFLYVGHYVSIGNEYMLKIGTTNDLERRKKEHTRNYRKTPNFPMPKEAEFEYDWFIPLSKYNTLRYEDFNKEVWKALGVGEYVRNDRFRCGDKPSKVIVKIRKEYVINL